jgi:subtilisin family serine protease
MPESAAGYLFVKLGSWRRQLTRRVGVISACGIMVQGLNLAAAPLYAQTPPPITRPPQTVTVGMKGRLVSETYGAVVTDMANAKLLDFETLSDDDGSPVEDLLRRTGRLPGDHASVQLIRLLCSANPHVCSTQKAGSGSTYRWRLTKASEGTIARPLSELCPSSALPLHVVCVPKVNLSHGLTSMVVPFASGKDDLRELLKANGGCSVVGKKCLRLVRKLNKCDPAQVNGGCSGKFPSDFTGTLIIPATEYRLTIDIKSATQFNTATQVIDDTIGVLERQYAWPHPQKYVYLTVEGGGLAAQGGRALTDAPNVLAALSTMGYPDRGSELLAKLEPIVVGVWDAHVDEDHCALKNPNGRSIVFQQALDLAPGDDFRFPRVAPCGTARSSAKQTLKWDHGTLVSGIIASRSQVDALRGANPTARLWAYEVSEKRLRDEDDPIVHLAKNTEERLPDVINISMGETDQFSSLLGALQSKIEQIIRSPGNAGYLFVAAAGNAPIGGTARQFNLGNACAVFPACLSIDDKVGRRVISVVALGSDGVTKLEGDNATNWGTAFDVAAVGHVGHIIDHDAVGAMQGTSVATPFVSGLASLLFAKLGRQSPAPIKELISYTTDLDESFDELVHFGRINYTRALSHLVTDSLTMLPNAACAPKCELVGTLRQNNTDELTITGGTRDGRPVAARVTIKATQLRRLFRPQRENEGPSAGVYVVYVDSDGALVKITDASFEGLPSLQFRSDSGGRYQPVPVSQIKDYTSAFGRGK